MAEAVAAVLREGRPARRVLVDVRNINEHYALKSVPRDTSRKLRKQEQEASRNLAALNASQPQNGSARLPE